MPFPSISKNEQRFHSIPFVPGETLEATGRRWLTSLPVGHPKWPVFIR